MLELLRTVEQLVATLGAHVHTWGGAGEGRGGEGSGGERAANKQKPVNKTTSVHAMRF